MCLTTVDVSLTHMLACLDDAAVVTDWTGRLIDCNEAFRAASGVAALDLPGRSIGALLHGPVGHRWLASVHRHFTHDDRGRWVGQVVLGRRQRRGRRCEVRIARMDQSAQPNLLFVLRDQALQRPGSRPADGAGLAGPGASDSTGDNASPSHDTDALTGLMHRRAFTAAVAGAIARAQHEGRRLALLVIDLDGFKLVNDGHGHAAGDAALASIARRYARVVGRDDLLARWGGDEFACLVQLRDGTTAADIGALAERLLRETAAAPPRLAGTGVGASIGIARMPEDATTAARLLACADQAVAEAKARGGRTWCPFTPELASRTTERVQLKADIQRAVTTDELQLYYQPIVDAGTLEPACVEALIRWIHPERGVMAPSTFLGLLTATADKTLRLLQIQIDRALADVAHLAPVVTEVAINVDARLIGRTEAFELLEPLHAALKEVDVVLCVELTEVAFGEQPAKLQSFIHDIRRDGMRLAIDDFGVGQASLLRLREISFDILKVDRAFIRGIAVSARDRTISGLAAQVAGELSGTSVAEGIETAAQVAWARRLGYHALQGFRIARPMPASELPAWYEAWQRSDRPKLLAEIDSEPALKVPPRAGTNLSGN